ncbi:NAD(P)-dependent oxidoreductase [Puteibacter caeruleilacunae]|nr:NAD(P)-dependent oxidoreductase [Puteibacter caeruleilacunae]
MKKILVTGASGFIGSFLVEEGLRRKFDVYATIRKGSNLQYLSDPKIHLLEIDFSDQTKLVNTWNKLKKEIPRFDYIIHNAGITAEIDAEEFDRVNHRYTRNLYLSLIAADFIPEKLILVSSLAAMGPGNAENMKAIDSLQLPQPLTAYGRSKLAAEEVLRKGKQIPYLIFRPTGVYGPRDKGYLSYFKLLNKHIEPYMASRKQLLSFIHVRDLVGAIYLGMLSPVTYKTYIASDGITYSNEEFAYLCKQILKKRTIAISLPYFIGYFIAWMIEKQAKRRGEPSIVGREKFIELTSENWSCAPVELQEDLNFSPRYGLRKGVEETLNWYKKNNWL